MKILITGGCGFLGSNLASHYLLEDSDVTIVDALYRKGSHENLEWLKNLNLRNSLVKGISINKETIIFIKVKSSSKLNCCDIYIAFK